MMSDEGPRVSSDSLYAESRESDFLQGGRGQRRSLNRDGLLFIGVQDGSASSIL